MTTGSLILEQLYEDREMTEGGFPVSQDGEKNLPAADHQLSIVTVLPTSPVLLEIRL